MSHLQLCQIPLPLLVLSTVLRLQILHGNQRARFRNMVPACHPE